MHLYVTKQFVRERGRKGGEGGERKRERERERERTVINQLKQ